MPHRGLHVHKWLGPDRVNLGLFTATYAMPATPQTAEDLSEVLAKPGPDEDVDEGVDGAVEEEERCKDEMAHIERRARHDPGNDVKTVERIEREVEEDVHGYYDDHQPDATGAVGRQRWPECALLRCGRILVRFPRSRPCDDFTGFLAEEFLDDADVAVDNYDGGDVELR